MKKKSKRNILQRQMREAAQLVDRFDYKKQKAQNPVQSRGD